MTDQWVYGIHAVEALLTNRHRAIKKLYVSDARSDQRIQVLLSLAHQMGVVVQRLTTDQMAEQFAYVSHQGVVACAAISPDYSERDLPQLLASSMKPCLILILDGVTDPHNLGACLRSADAAGVDFVISPKDKSASITSVVSKVACGAAESMPFVRVTNLVRTLNLLKHAGVWIYGAAGEAATTIYQLDLTSSTAIVMGAEGDGLRRLTREHCDGLFALPMQGLVRSLNVSVASGICLYEVVRQRFKLSAG